MQTRQYTLTDKIGGAFVAFTLFVFVPALLVLGAMEIASGVCGQ